MKATQLIFKVKAVFFIIAVITSCGGCSKSESQQQTVKNQASAGSVAKPTIPHEGQIVAVDEPMVVSRHNPQQLSSKELWQWVKMKNRQLIELERSNKLEGMSLTELETLLGHSKQTKEAGRILIYRLDTGLGGWEWTFEMQGAKVRTATRRSLN